MHALEAIQEKPVSSKRISRTDGCSAHGWFTRVRVRVHVNLHDIHSIMHSHAEVLGSEL
jgi:hypothetical protein